VGVDGGAVLARGLGGLDRGGEFVGAAGFQFVECERGPAVMLPGGLVAAVQLVARCYIPASRSIASACSGVSVGCAAIVSDTSRCSRGVRPGGIGMLTGWARLLDSAGLAAVAAAFRPSAMFVSRFTRVEARLRD